MKLEMKAIKHSEWASEETYCYQANVYLDGKPFAVVSNDGRGGCNRVEYHDASPLVKREVLNRSEPSFHFNCTEWVEKLSEIESYFGSLPNTDVGKYDFAPEGFGQTFETWCNDQLCEWLIAKDLRKAMKKRHLTKATINGKTSLYEFKFEVKVERIKRDFPDAIILNDIPFAEALEIYKETVDA